MKHLLLAISLISISLTGMAQGRDGESSKHAHSSKHYGKNILSFNPLHVISDNHVGVGVAYERLVNNYLGIKIPVMKSINSNYTNVSIEAKLYPARNNRAVTYAIAPTLSFGTGNQVWRYNTYNPTSSYYTDSLVYTPRTHFGFLLNQTLNVTIMKQLYIGMDGGIGINYMDDKYERWNQNQKISGISVAAQFHMSLGFRF